jgi:excisionase family DNA binding protein
MTTQNRSHRAMGTPFTLLTPAAAAVRLGCSDDHVYKLVSTGELCAVDISRKGAGKSKTRIRSDDLDAYIDARTRRAGRSAVIPDPAA